MDHLKIKVEVESAKPKLKQKLEKKLKEELQVRAEVELVKQGSIEKKIVDKR